MRSTYPSVLRALSVLAFLLSASTARAQVTPGSLWLSLEGGAGIYFGEFNTFETGGDFYAIPGFDGAVSLKYVFNPYIALSASAGYSNFIHRIIDTTRAKYASSFFGPVGTPTYPGSTVTWTDRNQIEIVRYTLVGQLNLFPRSTVVPYITAGIGLNHFTPRNNEGERLPTNLTGEYSRQAFIAPVGLGVEFYFSKGFTAFANGYYTFTTTDYLDGFANYLSYSSQATVNGPGTGPTNYDYTMGLTAGVSIMLYQPNETPLPPPDTTTPPRRDTGRTAPTTPSASERRFPPAGPLRPTPVDRDGDGLTDSEEQTRYRTDPENADSDGDALNDADELHLTNSSPNSNDTDGDGLNDGAEAIVEGSNPLLRDTDSDGLTDGEEVNRTLTSPLSADSDNDGVNDRTDPCPQQRGGASGCP